MDIPKISKRLEAAASFMRRGGRIADIGTDHAYLPIYLCATGAAVGGVASDINEGPTQRARANTELFGAQDKIAVVRTDGLGGIEKYAPDDIFILGMGGELIVKIIDEAPWVKEGKRLILQPMTHPEIVREYLFANGFSVIDETLVEDEKIYQIICAEYTGVNSEATPLELLVGRLNTKRGGELLTMLLRNTRRVYCARVEGKAQAGADASAEQAMINEIDDILRGGDTK